MITKHGMGEMLLGTYLGTEIYAVGMMIVPFNSEFWTYVVWQ